MNNEKKYICKCHPDFHIPEDAIVGTDFDGDDYARKAKAAGIEKLVMFAKCHYGFCYYPTKIGNVHPGLQKDMLAEFVKGCRNAGLGVACYYSVFLDTAIIKKHPDWMLQPGQNQPKEGLLFSKKYLPVCVNSPYLDELLIPQALEIIENYDIDELFYDTMTNFIPCYCENCRRKFGKSIPQDNRDADWLEYVKWYYNQYREFYSKILQTIHEKNPNVLVTVNWEWSARMPDQPVPYIKHLRGDLFTSGSDASFFCRYWAGTGLSFDYMCGRFLHHLGDWSNNTPETLKYTAAATIANGGGFYLIDRQMSEGHMEDRAYAITKEVFDFINERRDYVTDTEHIPETAVLYPFEHVVGPRFEIFPDNKKRSDRIRQFKAIANILVNNAKHYTAMNSENLREKIDNYRLLILPEVDYLGSETIETVKRFVYRGGKLIIIQSDNKDDVNLDLFELAGVKYHGRESLDYSYIESETNGIEDPILVRGHFALVTPHHETVTLARNIAPLRVGKAGSEFGHGFAPPSKWEGYSAVTYRTYGQGKVIYIAGPILTSHEVFHNPYISRLLIGLYDKLLPDPLVKVECKGHVEMTAMRKDNDLIVHLVNHSGKEILAGGYCPVTEFIPEIRDISLSIKSSKAFDSVLSIPDGSSIKPEFIDGYLSLKLPCLEIMTSVAIKGYFDNNYK